MTDPNILLQMAARCRRMAALCSSEIIARKFEALALDYEEHARRAEKSALFVEFSESASSPQQHGDEDGANTPPQRGVRAPAA